VFPTTFIQEVVQLNHVATHRVGFTYYYHYYYDDITFMASSSWGMGLLFTTESPKIVLEPQDQSVTMGSNAILAEMATGSPPLSYRWEKDGYAIAGETSSSLLLSDTQQSDSGTYTVSISNAVGSVPSRSAVLTITPSSKVVSAISPESLVHLADGEFRFGCTSPNWRRFVFETSFDLLSWVPFSTNTLVDGSIVVFDTQATNCNARFYRTVAVP
jgi:Immunoglobulin domain